VLRALSGGGLGEDSLLKLMFSLRNPVPGDQHKEDSLPEEVWEENSLLKLMISLRKPVLRAAQRG